ncbi:hypothetical protein [Fournierella sp.]
MNDPTSFFGFFRDKQHPAGVCWISRKASGFNGIQAKKSLLK